MAFVDLDRIAYKIGDVPFAQLSEANKARLTYLVNAVEQKLQRPPWSFNLTTSTITEYLPGGGRVRDEVDLADYKTSNGSIIPLDHDVGSSALQLSHTPVLAAGLVVREDRGAEGGTVAGSFGASSLLTSGVDYYLDITRDGISTTGKVVRISGTWAREPRSIKITYKAGPYAVDDAALGLDFLELYEETVCNCVLHGYTFWKRQQTSIAGGDNGLIPTSESIGKYSRGMGGQKGSIMGGQFEFGSTPEIAPDELCGALTPFVNLGRLWSNG